MLKEILRPVCALALAVSLTADASPTRQVGHLPGVETPIKGQGSFITRGGTRFDWHNYTDHTFNPAAAREMFSYFQDLIPANGLSVHTVYRGRTLQAILSSRQGIQQVTLFITPENTPRPSNVTINIPGRRADLMNRELVIAACQEFIWIVRFTGSRPLNEQAANQAQEGLCRSLWVTFTLKQQKVPYDIYRDLRGVRIGSDHELTILDEKNYNGIPLVGGVIKPGN